MGWHVTSPPEGADYLPRAPGGGVVALTGTIYEPIRFAYRRPEYRKAHRELRTRGAVKPLVVVVQRRLDPAWGLKVWMQDPDSCGPEWWWQTTHVRNTLLEDREFVAALVEAGMVEMREGA